MAGVVLKNRSVIIKRKIKPKSSEQDIADYWFAKIYEGDLGVDYTEATERCWRCGYKRNLEKCHIIPHSMGGTDNADNLVLLCNMCHREAPDVKDSKLMFSWIKQTKSSVYDMFWTDRAWREFVTRRGGLKPNEEKVLMEAGKEIAKIHLNKINKKDSIVAKIFDEAYDETTTHFSVGFSLETRVFVFDYVLDKLLEYHESRKLGV